MEYLHAQSESVHFLENNNNILVMKKIRCLPIKILGLIQTHFSNGETLLTYHIGNYKVPYKVHKQYCRGIPCKMILSTQNKKKFQNPMRVNFPAFIPVQRP